MTIQLTKTGQKYVQPAYFSQKLENKQRETIFPSPGLRPATLFESPALNPRQPPIHQPEYSYSFFGRRKASLANENNETLGGRKGTEDAIDPAEELKKTNRVKSEVIVSIRELKEEEDDIDPEGFKRPKELRIQEKSDNESSETPSVNPQKECPGIIKEEEKTPQEKDILKSTINANSLELTSTKAKGLPPNFHLKLPGDENEPQQSPSEHIFPSPFLQASPMLQQHSNPSSTHLMPLNGFGLQREFSLDSSEPNPLWQQIHAQEHPRSILDALAQIIPDPEKVDKNRLIGTLTATERQVKIRKYLEKRKRRIWRKKISYDCRKKMADKRLRIKGRFVTRDQACALLGTTAEDLSSNELLKNLVSSNTNCSIITSAQNMKIRNIQTLFMPSASRRREQEPKKVEEHKDEKKDLKVEILKSNANEQIVEIKIEAFPKKAGELLNNLTGVDDKDSKQPSPVAQSTTENGSDNGIVMQEIPCVHEPVFALKRLKFEEQDKRHTKYHKSIPKEQILDAY